MAQESRVGSMKNKPKSPKNKPKLPLTAYDKIVALGESVSSMSGAKVGRKVGCSRERVRQLCRSLPYKPCNLRDEAPLYGERVKREFLRLTRFHSFPLLIDERGPNECWPWLGVITPQGYGMTWPREYVHRAAYKHFIGPIPKGQPISHKCELSSCCNPRHLYAGTPKSRAWATLRGGKFRPWGGRISPAIIRLCREDIDAIIKAYADAPRLPWYGTRTRVAHGFYAQLAKRYGISKDQARGIVRRESGFWLPTRREKRDLAAKQRANRG